MSKTIYYLGAGASYGRRNKTGNIVEGIPIVAEIPEMFEEFKDSIKTTLIPDGAIRLQGIYQTDNHSVSRAKEMMLSDIDSIIMGIRAHSTIDTYAKKLFLIKNYLQLEKLKDVLCSFLIWCQAKYPLDGRYDSFFANVLEADILMLPKNISVISWNYDSQLEFSFRAYSANKMLPVFDKNSDKGFQSLPNCGRIFKVNGSASFFDAPIFQVIQDSNSYSVEVLLIMLYSNVRADTQLLGYNFKTHLSFAWEKSSNNDKMMEYIKDTVSDTEQVVVIGYSFPFFNREIDREIFRYMSNLQTIYIQDINPIAVSQTLEAVLRGLHGINIVTIPNCDQFYLPKEL